MSPSTPSGPSAMQPEGLRSTRPGVQSTVGKSGSPQPGQLLPSSPMPSSPMSSRSTGKATVPVPELSGRPPDMDFYVTRTGRQVVKPARFRND